MGHDLTETKVTALCIALNTDLHVFLAGHNFILLVLLLLCYQALSLEAGERVPCTLHCGPGPAGRVSGAV